MPGYTEPKSAAVYVRLPRACRHTERSLAVLRRVTCTSARRGRAGVGPAGMMPADLAAQLPRWHSRAHMLKLVHWLLTQPRLQELCDASGGLALETWAAITINDIRDADYATGQGMRTSKEVAAVRVGRDAKQVERARGVNLRLGIYVEVYRGCELGGDERRELVRQDPGNQQRGIANHYQLGVCPPAQRSRLSTPRPGRYAQVKASVALPRRGHFSLPSHLLGPLPIAAAGASEATAAPPGLLPGRRRRPGMALAHEILAHPGIRLFTGVPAGTLAGQLKAFQVGGWHGYQLGDFLIKEAYALGIDPTRIATRPHAALKALLSQIDPIAQIVLGTGDRAADDQSAASDVREALAQVDPADLAALALARVRAAARAKGLRPGSLPASKNSGDLLTSSRRDGGRDPALLGDQMPQLLTMLRDSLGDGCDPQLDPDDPAADGVER